MSMPVHRSKPQYWKFLVIAELPLVIIHSWPYDLLEIPDLASLALSFSIEKNVINIVMALS